jgi:hypothetical protein
MSRLQIEPELQNKLRDCSNYVWLRLTRGASQKPTEFPWLVCMEVSEIIVIVVIGIVIFKESSDRFPCTKRSTMQLLLSALVAPPNSDLAAGRKKIRNAVRLLYG